MASNDDIIRQLLQGTGLGEEENQDLPPIPFRPDFDPEAEAEQEARVQDPVNVQLERMKAQQATLQGMREQQEPVIPEAPIAPVAQPIVADEAPSSPVDELSAAMDQRDKDRRRAMLLDAAAQIGEAGVRRADPSYKRDKGFTKQLLQQADQPVADIKAKRKFKADAELAQQRLRKGGYDIKNLDSLNDPTSQVSMMYRQVAQGTANKLVKDGEIDEEIDMTDLSAAQIAPIMKIMEGGGDLSAYQTQSLGLRREELAYRKESEKRRIGAEARRKAAQKHKEKEKDELSDKQTEQLIALDDGMSLANRMENLLPKVEESMGVYASKIEEGKRYIPMMERDPEFVEMQQIVGTELADYIKTISGAAVSEEEAQRLHKNIPNMDDKPAEFKRKLETFMSLLKEYKANKISGFEKQGKDPSSFKETTDAPQSGTVQMRIPDGRVKMIPADKVEAAKAAGAVEI